MSLTETKTPSIVLIEWCDASHEFGWQDGNEVSNEEPNLTCFSVGWLLVKTKTHIKLCQTYASENHAQTLIIPAGMIRSITVLKPSVVRNGNKGK